MKLVRYLLILLAALLVNPGHAAPLLSGDVSFDESNLLYTYTYVIDADQLPPEGFREWGIRLSPDVNTSLVPRPTATTEPDGWRPVFLFGGWPDEPVNFYGTDWGWWSLGGVDVKPSGLMTFSFSTPVAPYQGSLNNYFLYSSVSPHQPIAIGRIVGPDMTIPTVPEPASALIWLTGLLVTFSVRARTLTRPAV